MKELRLKELREDKELLQKDLAKILNISQQHYSMYENELRYLPIYHLNTLAEFYNTSADYILNRTDEKKPYPKNTKKDA